MKHLLKIQDPVVLAFARPAPKHTVAPPAPPYLVNGQRRTRYEYEAALRKGDPKEPALGTVRATTMQGGTATYDDLLLPRPMLKHVDDDFAPTARMERMRAMLDAHYSTMPKALYEAADSELCASHAFGPWYKGVAPTKSGLYAIQGAGYCTGPGHYAMWSEEKGSWSGWGDLAYWARKDSVPSYGGTWHMWRPLTEDERAELTSAEHWVPWNGGLQAPIPDGTDFKYKWEGRGDTVFSSVQDVDNSWRGITAYRLANPVPRHERELGTCMLHPGNVALKALWLSDNTLQCWSKVRGNLIEHPSFDASPEFYHIGHVPPKV